jgi:hypothetical protein
MARLDSMTFASLAGTALAVALIACGGSSGPKLTPEQEVGATALCKKGAACEGVTNPTSAQMNQCKEQIAGALQIFPDPQAFAACIDALTCDQVENDADAVIACVDWDTSTILCSTTNANVLNGCNHAGKCAAANCNDVCKLLGGTYDHCGYDSSKSHDVCWCRA